MSPESFAYRSYTRSFKAKFLVVSTWIRGFQVKGTLKALCQEGLILNPLNFCRFFLFKKNVMMSKLCTQMRLESDSEWNRNPLRFLCVIYAQLCVNGNSANTVYVWSQGYPLTGGMTDVILIVLLGAEVLVQSL